MVMVGEHRPRFQLPAVRLRQREQPSFEQVELGGGIEQMTFVKRAARDEVNAVWTESVNRCMRPILGGKFVREVFRGDLLQTETGRSRRMMRFHGGGVSQGESAG